MAAGNFAAVRSGLKASKSSLGPTESRQAQREHKLLRRHYECSQDLVKTYDESGSGKLHRHEVRNLLVNLNDEVQVSDDELNFVMKVADANGDQSICPSEMSALLSCWDNYQKSRNEIEQHFSKHDPSGTGRLDKQQLKRLLTEVNRGQPVSDEEVQWVLSQADVLKNGVITKPELRRALALWESRREAAKACCVVQ